jgi:hypothetical protein
VLRAISDDENHVLTFYPLEPDPHGHLGLKVQKRGWREASTFAAFCDRHDAAIFAPLEASSFSGSKKQIFLIAYRAICWELYQKTRALKSQSIRQRLLDRGAPEHVQRGVQAMLRDQDAGFGRGLEDSMRVKGGMDKSLLMEDYSPYETYEIQLEGPLAIAATGAITPNQSIRGVRLQTLHDVDAQTQWLSFGVDMRDAGPSAVFFWRSNESAPKQYMEEVKALGERELAEFLAQFFFVHCENTYFASSWWEALGEVQQKFMAELMANSNPYYFPPNYELDRAIAPWRIASRHPG